MNPRTQNTATLRTAERKHKAIELRRAGATYDQIAREIGVSRTRAHQYIKSEMLKLDAEMEEEAKVLRQLDLQRLDRLMSALWAKAINGSNTSIDRCLKIIERRARIAGYEVLMRGDEDAGTPTEVYIVREDKFTEEQWTELAQAQLRDGSTNGS